MNKNTDFALSRIQAEGWNAAQKYMRSGQPGDAKKISALNPYCEDSERARWFAGFNHALEKM